MNRFLETAIEAARIGGKILMDGIANKEGRKIDRKQAFDFVTEIDLLSEEAILDFIRKRHPDHRMLAEESGGVQPDQGHVWIVDPLDGTKNYIHQFPMFGVSVALAFENQPVVGAILDPVRNELFHCEKNGGAFLNGQPIQTSATTDLSSFLVATGFPFRAKHLSKQYFQAFMELFQQVSDMRRAGAACLDLAYVACGRLDAFWEVTLNSWDIAAGVLLIEEAGGQVTDIWGGARYMKTGHIVASNGPHHRHITDVVGKVFEGLAE